MKKRKYNQLVTTTSLIALLSASPWSVSAQSEGQEAQSESAGVVIEEVIVQARRIEENIQRVPLSITALSADDLQQQDIRDFFNASKNVPGLTVCCVQGQVNFIFMRGLTSVPTYFADVPINPSGYGQNLDLANLQVMKGPQGTLFGLPSNGGAVLYQPARPEETFGGYVSGSIGTFGRNTLEGALNVPIIDDKLLVRVAGQHHHRDGYIKDLSTDKDLNDENYWTARFSAIFRPTENLENYTIIQYEKDWQDHYNGLAGVAKAVDPNPFSLVHLVFGSAIDDALAVQNELGPYQVAGLNLDKNIRFRRELTAINTTTWDITDNVAVKNILGYQNTKSFGRDDIDSVPLDIINASDLWEPPTSGDPAWSEELQIQGSFFDEQISYTVGTFHRQAISSVDRRVITFFGAPTVESVKNTDRSRGVYGQTTLDLSSWLLDGLSVTAGVRRSWQTVTQSNSQIAFTPGVPVEDFPSTLELYGKSSFTATSWTAGAQYQMTPDTMVFTTVSKGYSSGGLTLTAPPPFDSFGPEKLTNVEAGVKTTFGVGDALVRGNLTGFYGWFDDVIVSVTRPVQISPPPAPPSVIVVSENAAKARISGFEADVTMAFPNGFELGGTVAYTDNKYTRWMSSDPLGQPLDLSSTRFILVPKWKWSLNGTYYLPVDPSWGDVSLTADLFHRVDYTGELVTADMFQADVHNHPGYYNLDLALNWEDITGIRGLSARLSATNVTQNHVADGHLTTYVAIGYSTEGVAPPRMVNLSLRYEF